MNNLTEVEAKKLASIGTNKNSHNVPTTSSPAKSRMQILLVWLIGIVISLIPIFASKAIPEIIKIKSLEIDYGDILTQSITSYQVLFIGFSLTITSLTEYILNKNNANSVKKGHKRFLIANVFLSLISLILYFVMLCLISAEIIDSNYSSFVFPILTFSVVGVNLGYKLLSD